MEFSVSETVQRITDQLNQDMVNAVGPVVEQITNDINSNDGLPDEVKASIISSLANVTPNMTPEQMILTKATVEQIFLELDKIPQVFGVMENPEVGENLPPFIIYKLPNS